jgi:predicted permease
MMLRGAPHRIVGVMPAGFAVGGTADVWTPLRASPTTAAGQGESYSIVGRLRPGATWADAEAEINRAGRASLDDLARAGIAVTLRLTSLHHALALGYDEVLIPLWGAAALVLLVGCVNIAGLMLARSGPRRREIATRMALGSGRGGVVRQLLVESLALALCGGAAGTLVGLIAIAAVRPLVTDMLGMWQPIALDWRVLTMTLAASLATSVMFGLAPVLDACRVDLRAALNGSHGASRRAPSTYLPRCAVVVAEIALSVALLVAAGLLLRTFAHLQRQDAGFDPRGVLAATVSLEDARYASRDRLDRLFEATLARIRALPGVTHAAVGLRLPYEEGFNTAVTHFDGRAIEPFGRIANVTYVTPEYFDTLGIARLQGRTFDARDGAQTTPVVVVNQAFVNSYLRDRPAIGTHMELFAVGGREIVGVVNTIQHAPRMMDGRPNSRMPAVYLLTSQTSAETFALAHGAFSPSVIVRTTDASGGRGMRDMSSLADAIRHALAVVDPHLPIGAIHTAHDLKTGAYSVYRFEALALSGFAVLALLLAAVGIYGIVAHDLTERRRELSIRSAIGATRWQAVRAAAAPGLRLAAAGVVLGCFLGWLAALTLRHLIVGVTTADLLTFTTVAGTLFAVAAAASLLPALAAARLDVADTLRAE